MDDLDREKRALFKEVGLDDEAKPTNENEPIEKMSDRIKQAADRMFAEFDIDPTGFNVFSRDQMRVDVGLLIQRAPIFMTMRDRDVHFMKFKNDIMNEYYCNQRQFADEFEEVSKLNEDVLGDNPYSSKMNLDNYPTHRVWGSEPGNTAGEYCAASKYYSNVDPNMADRRTIHYAGEDRTYLIVKSKHTGEWEFPTGRFNFGQTFMRAKQNLFQTIAQDAQKPDDTIWKIKYFGQAPIAATIRELTPFEKQDKTSQSLKGVRTYYFQANHWRGLPAIANESDWADFAWIPKRQLNEYFERDYYEIFIHSTSTR